MARFTPLQWGVFIAVAVSVAVSMTFTILYLKVTPPAPPPASGTPIFGSAPNPQCAAIQNKIDAAGQPGWDGLSLALQTEIQTAPPECVFMGDGKSY
jgi:hypothetical protein